MRPHSLEQQLLPVKPPSQNAVGATASVISDRMAKITKQHAKLSKKLRRIRTTAQPDSKWLKILPLRCTVLNRSVKTDAIEITCVNLDIAVLTRRVAILRVMGQRKGNVVSGQRRQSTSKSLDRTVEQDVVMRQLLLQSEWMHKVRRIRHSSEFSKRSSKGVPEARLTTLVSTLSRSWSESKDLPTMDLVDLEDAFIETRLYGSLLGATIMRYVEALQRGDMWAAGLNDKYYEARVMKIYRQFQVQAGKMLPHSCDPHLMNRAMEYIFFARLGAVVFLCDCATLNVNNTIWTQTQRSWKNADVTLTAMGHKGSLVKLLGHGKHRPIFERSIAAFSTISQVFPSRAANDVLDGIHKLYEEASSLEAHLVVTANELLPLIIYVLSRAQLSNVHSVLHLLQYEAFGSPEAKYYISCMHAAVSYMMHNDP